MKLPCYVETVLEILSGNGFEAYVVGGSVRDMLMDTLPGDFDVTTNALPAQTMECFKDYRVIETGIKHGTVTVIIDGESVEITTYRVDGEYLDNRRPQSVEFTRSLEEDLARRDFTMNAIAYNPAIGIVDPFGGFEDINKGTIRCVGNPDRRFNEDGLRILRGLRFASQTGFEMEAETARSVIKNRNLVKNLSAERVFNELKKLLCGDGVHKVMSEYSDVFGVFLPEIMPMVGFEQNTKYHCYDVFEHTMTALENCEKNEIVRLAVLFHDIGKPVAYVADADGVSHFKGHAEISARMTKDILTRLKADNSTKKTVCDLIEEHSVKINITRCEIKKYISKKGFEFTKLLMKVKKADASAKAEAYRNPPEFFEAERLIGEIEKSGEPMFLGDLEISGKEISEMGITGKKVGEILERLLDEVICGRTENKADKLTKRAKEMTTDEKD